MGSEQGVYGVQLPGAVHWLLLQLPTELFQLA
jgi:hypothetical protein